MSFQDYLYDLLFEMASQERHNILLILRDESANLTYLSNKSGLNLPETRRHVTRLMDVDLVERNPDGKYSLTYFGLRILELVEEFSFFTQHKEYFLTHSIDYIPREFRLRLRDLSKSEFHDNILIFIRAIDQVIRYAEKEIWLLVDQFPLNHLSIILEAVERGIRFKIIEPQNRFINPDLEALAPRESIALDKMRYTPLVEQRMFEDVNLLMIMSEKECVIAFPTIEGEFDYRGFRSSDKTFLAWCRELFQHYWGSASRRTPMKKVGEPIEGSILGEERSNNFVVIVGQERPEFDYKAIQDAVDRYDEVILKGRFNIGTSTIVIKRSIKLRGEGRTNDIPDTKIYKKGWNFPFMSQEFLLTVRGDFVDVIIENIHFENFNGTCIGSNGGHSLIIRKNRITLLSGFGRGLSFGKWGDHVVGITAAGGENQVDGFPGGITIEDNYLDFALSYPRGGFISHDGRELDPNYRPDLQNHEAPICVGMNIHSNVGNVIIKNNLIKNMNSRGILVFDNYDTAVIKIQDNKITSEVFGAYPYNSPMAGVGVFVQSAWSEPRKGTKIELTNNKIYCEKVNYCGIAVHGPAIYTDGVGKLESCVIKNNDIELKNGLYGIQLRKSDNTEIINNIIKGNVYYGLQINGSKNRGKLNLSSNKNIFLDNNLEFLQIKPPDDYSNKHVDGYRFTGVENNSKTAHVWLNTHSKENVIMIKDNETFIDEGQDNKIEVN